MDSDKKLGAEGKLDELGGKLKQGVGDHCATGRPQAVIVETQDLKAAIVREERNHGLDRSTAEGIVAEVDLDEGRFVFQSVAY